jgi:hypothetical protein
MTRVKIEPERILVNFLRNTLTDINGSRSGQWIYPDFPRVTSLGDASYPRVGITMLTESSTAMGMFDDTQWETVSFQIDVVTKKDLLFTATLTDEALGTMSSAANSNRFTYDEIPSSVTNIKHDGTSYGTVTRRNTDADFTTPAAGTVEYSGSTGNLNFAAADLVTHDTEAITSTYTVALEGKKVVEYIGRDIIKQIRTGWRTDTTFAGLYYPNKISNSSLPLDEDLGIYRQMLEYQCNAFNLGEGI